MEKKLIIVIFILFCIFNTNYHNSSHVYDFAKVHYGSNMKIFKPVTTPDLQDFLLNNKSTICIKGAGYSHGGNTLCNNSIQIDTSFLNKMKYNKLSKTITLGSGCIWYDVIRYLAKYNRTVAEMQSYYNFSVGGSISVNCHGRGMKYGSISDTIISLKIITADGKIIKCSKKDNYKLFKGVVGGYSLLGIILEAELKTEYNDILKLKVLEHTTIDESINFLKNNDDVCFYNSNIYPGSYDKIIGYYWCRTDNYNTKMSNHELYKPMHNYYLGTMAICTLIKLLHPLKIIRGYIEPKIEKEKKQVVYRSYQIADDANSLKEVFRNIHTSILQEYFIPINKINYFLPILINKLKDINILNISFRYVKKIKHSILNYSPTDSIAIVLYFSIWNNKSSFNKLCIWTNDLLKYIIKCKGNYYLPYLLCYNPTYITKLYNFNKLLQLKKIYDPNNKINNMFINHLTSNN